jgi:aminopeptidase N
MIHLPLVRSVQAFALIAAQASGQVAKIGSDSEPFRIAYYDLRVDVRPDAKTIRGCVRSVGWVGASSLPELILEFAPALVVDSAFAPLRGGLRRLDVVHTGYVLGLSQSRGWSAHHSIDIRVCYHGMPSATALQFTGSGDSARIGSYGLPYSAREWWPVHDAPAPKADSADIEITAPGGLTAVSNGRFVGRVTNGDGSATTHWSVRYPVYPDVISLAIASYATFSLEYREPSGKRMPLQFFVFPEDEAKARVDFSVLPEMLAHHTARFGDYPFWREKYGVAEFPIESFREHQTVPSYGPRFITGDHRNDWILAHELAHQWFGDAVTVQNWSDAWLNEGFATYAAFLWIERAHGKAAYDSVIATKMKLDYPGTVFLADSSDVDHMFERETFFKGALVLHMLRHVLGDTLFFRAVRSYVAENLHKNVTTTTLQLVCERMAHQPLGWFFTEWIYRTGAPAYRLTWTMQRRRVGTDRRFVVDLTVKQIQDGQTFAMPLDIALRTARGMKLETVIDSVRTLRATVVLTDSVTNVVLDPGNWILKRPD